MGRNYFEDQKEILQKIKGKSNKGIYFRSIGYKQIDDILKQYIEYLSKDNKVYLITDEDAPEKKNIYLECELIHLPSATKANWDQYKTREDYIIDIIKQKNIKEVFYFSPTSHVAALDEMVIAALDCKFSIYLDEYMIKKERNREEKSFIKGYDLLEKAAESVLNKNDHVCFLIGGKQGDKGCFCNSKSNRERI